MLLTKSDRQNTYAYRITSSNFPDFNGEGTHRSGGRWVSPGRYAINASESYSLGVLEYIQWNGSNSVADLICIKVEIPPDIYVAQVENLLDASLGNSDYTRTREIGDRWYDRGESVVLRLPSVVSPYESNLLFNQEHADFSRITICMSHPVILNDC